MEQYNLKQIQENQNIESQNQEGQKHSQKPGQAELASTIQDTRNAKERLYDQIHISLKTLDIIIAVLSLLFVGLMIYFIIAKLYS